MSDGMNRVYLLGMLVADPTLHPGKAEESILALQLSTTSRRREGEGWVPHTEVHAITVKGRRAEALHRILRKGERIMVEGELCTVEHRDQSGKISKSVEVHAREVVLLGKDARKSKNTDGVEQ